MQLAHEKLQFANAVLKRVAIADLFLFGSNMG